MEIFGQTNFDFLGKKWPFIIASLVLTVAGFASLGIKGGPRYGIDFRGGALMDVKFSGPPPDGKIRSALEKNIKGDITVQNVGGSSNEVLIGTELKSDQELAAARAAMTQTLEATFIPQQAKGLLEFNNAGAAALVSRLQDPLVRNGVSLSDQQLQDLVGRVVAYRDREQSGLLTSFRAAFRRSGRHPAGNQHAEAGVYASALHGEAGRDRRPQGRRRVALAGGQGDPVRTGRDAGLHRLPV